MNPLDATIEEFAADGYARRVLLPSMPCDPAEADQLAPSHLDGPDHRTTLSTATLRGVRWSVALSQAVANG
jgi:hypothetical protein